MKIFLIAVVSASFGIVVGSMITERQIEAMETKYGTSIEEEVAALRADLVAVQEESDGFREQMWGCLRSHKRVGEDKLELEAQLGRCLARLHNE